MSFIHNVLLSFSDEECWGEAEAEPCHPDKCPPLQAINKWIKHGELVSLIEPTYVEGVGYGMHANLYGGGFNHFDFEGFVRVVEAQDWKDREHLQVWLKAEEEQSFSPVPLRRRRQSNPNARPVRPRKVKAKSPVRRMPPGSLARR